MATITEDYVSFETAKLLKEKGFDEICFTWYTGKGKFKQGKNTYDDYHMNHFSDMAVVRCSAPTFQTACKWLKEVHNIFIAPTVGETDGKFWYDADIIPINGKVIYWKSLDVQLPMLEEDSPEKAIEKALKYCLENLI